jgi:hypothetical protein
MEILGQFSAEIDIADISAFVALPPNARFTLSIMRGRSAAPTLLLER